jgi:hypothetical protein
MGRWYRIWRWAVLAAASLLLGVATSGSGEQDFPRRGSPSFDPGGGKSVRLSLKISGAKKRKRQVSFYKSVARQAKIRTTVDRTPSSER